MSVPWPIVLAMALLTGCVSSPAADGVGPNDAPESRFGEPIVAAVADNPLFRSGEAFVAVSPDGAEILTCGHGFFNEPSPMYASTDGGTSWRELDPPANAPVGGDCEVAIGADGAWHFVASSAASAAVLTTRDEGDTWTVAPLATLPINGMADRPWLSAIGDTLVLAAMPLHMEPGAISVTRSTDGGASFGPPKVLATPTHKRTHAMHSAPFGTGDTVHIAIQRGPPDYVSDRPRDLVLATSTDAGATWTERVVLEDTPMMRDPPTAAAQGGDSTLYLAFVRVRSGVEELVCVTSLDGGKTWSQPRLIAGGWEASPLDWGLGSAAGHPAMAGREDGTATIAWMSDAEPVAEDLEGSFLFVARLDARAETFVQWLEPVAPAFEEEFHDVTHDTSGRAHVTYTDSGRTFYVRER